MNDKDVFQTFYAQLLAKRLVTKSYISKDLESSYQVLSLLTFTEEMLDKLKMYCGFEYWLKCNRMFVDIENSEKFCERYGESTGYKAIPEGCVYIPSALCSTF